MKEYDIRSRRDLINHKGSVRKVKGCSYDKKDGPYERDSVKSCRFSEIKGFGSSLQCKEEVVVIKEGLRVIKSTIKTKGIT